MGAVESIMYKAFEYIPGLGVLYAVPRSIYFAAKGDGGEAVATALNIFQGLVRDATIVLAPELALPVSIAMGVEENMTDQAITELFNHVKTKENLNNMLQDPTLKSSVPVLISNRCHTDHKEKAEIVKEFLCHRASILQYGGKFNYRTYADNENAWLIFPKGVGLNRPFWFQCTWTTNAGGVSKASQNCVCTIVQYKEENKQLKFKTDGSYYTFAGFVDIVNRKINFTIIEPNSKQYETRNFDFSLYQCLDR
jgi:hypothetical protein